MFIRMKEGRYRGRAVDIREEEARAMLAKGQALPVDLSIRGELDRVVDFDAVVTEKPKVEAPLVADEAETDSRPGKKPRTARR
jgi:hypothetical protein